MAIITLTMTAPERLITRMEPNVVTMISRVHLWLNVESAGMGTTTLSLPLPYCDVGTVLSIKRHV